MDYSEYFKHKVVEKHNRSFNKTSAENILNKLEEDKKHIILLCGEVQSGKTNHTLNLIDTAFTKYDYDIVLFLCGTTNNLKSQSIQRINNKFENRNKNFEVVQQVSSSKTKILIPLLKETSNLKKMHEDIFEKIHFLKHKKILIIDDESDYASVNTSSKTTTKINDLITKIYKLISDGKGGMILVTATPYANILNTKNETIIRYIFSFATPENYTGINFFNNLENFYISDTSSLSFNTKDEMYKQIVFATFVWLYKSYIFLKNFPNEKSTFLIYVSDETMKHNKCKHHLNEIVNNFNNKYRKHFVDWLAKENEFLSEDEIDEIVSWINNDIKKSIFVLNSNNKSGESTINEINQKRLCIVIGGVMLSRGITYENLLTELFLHYSQDNVNADVLLQRCRWFGYRKTSFDGRPNDRYKYMNLITKNEIINSLKEAEKCNDILFNPSGIERNFPDVMNKLRQLESQLNIGTTNDRKK